MEDNLSQIITSVSVASRLTQTSVLRPKSKLDCHAPRHRFKTHSQCQRRGQIPLADRGRISCFHLWSILPAVRRTAARRPGGAYRDRTDDLKLAKLALSQLS